jgi:hypothetical protein
MKASNFRSKAFLINCVRGEGRGQTGSRERGIWSYQIISTEDVIKNIFPIKKSL